MPLLACIIFMVDPVEEIESAADLEYFLREQASMFIHGNQRDENNLPVTEIFVDARDMKISVHEI